MADELSRLLRDADTSDGDEEYGVMALIKDVELEGLRSERELKDEQIKMSRLSNYLMGK